MTCVSNGITDYSIFSETWKGCDLGYPIYNLMKNGTFLCEHKNRDFSLNYIKNFIILCLRARANYDYISGSLKAAASGFNSMVDTICAKV